MVATSLFESRSGSPTMDLYGPDTYYVIPHIPVFYLLSLYFVACAAIYLICGRVLRKIISLPLAHVHFWLSTISVAILLYAFHKVPRLLGSEVAGVEAAMHSLAELGFVAFFAFLAAQIVFVTNVIWSFFRRTVFP